MIRAKFTLTEVRASMYGSYNHDTKETTQVEMRTLVFSPVYGNGDPNHENTKFWKASPSGRLELGTINPEAWKQFELGKEYYLDFSPAPAPAT